MSENAILWCLAAAIVVAFAARAVCESRASRDSKQRARMRLLLNARGYAVENEEPITQSLARIRERRLNRYLEPDRHRLH